MNLYKPTTMFECWAPIGAGAKIADVHKQTIDASVNKQISLPTNSAQPSIPSINAPTTNAGSAILTCIIIGLFVVSTGLIIYHNVNESRKKKD
jgi:hypothetical protein